MARLAETPAVHGLIEASFCADRRATVSSSAPLELRGPFAGFPAPLYYLRNVTSGTFGGDLYDVSLVVESGTAVQVASSAATKVHEAAGQPALTETTLEVLADSQLVWGPHATVLQQGASLKQRLRCRTQTGANLVIAEVLSFGRLASGERLRFASYEMDLLVESQELGPLYEERYVLDPDSGLAAAIGDFGALVSVYAIGIRPELEEVLATSCHDDVYAGYSALPNNCGWVLKALTGSLSAGLALCTRVIKNPLLWPVASRHPGTIH